MGPRAEPTFDLTRFPVDDAIAEGGSSRVFRARDRATGETVALKVARRDHPAMRRRFEREAAALRHLDGGIAPRLVASGIGPDGPWLAMERIEGETIAALIAKQQLGPGCPEASLEIARGLVFAVEQLQARGVVHGDLKAENALVVPRHEQGAGVTLVDFGSAGLEGSLHPDERAGTLATAAPEQLRGEPADERSDIYACGAVLFELFTGRPPFVGPPAAVAAGHAGERPPRLGDLAPVSPELEALVLRCLAKSPADRPVSARVVREALDTIDASPPAVTRAPAQERRIVATTNERTAVVLVADCAVVATASAAVRSAGGYVARQRGPRLVAAFLGDAHDAPSQQARSAAVLLLRDGARVALHVAPVRIRPGIGSAKPHAVSGRAIDAPEVWLPSEPWTGLVTTPALQALERAPGPLRGRAAEVERVHEVLMSVLDEAIPALVLFLGREGIGKSRLLTHLQSIIADAVPRATAVRLHGREGCANELADRIGTDDDPAQRRDERAKRLAARLGESARQGPVVVFVEDAHLADDVVLDALETAVLEGAGARLLVVCEAEAAIERARPGFGERGPRHVRVELDPLDAESARSLAADLLTPAEYPSEELLEQLAHWAGREPGRIVELTRAIHLGGFVRQQPDGRSHRLEGALLEKLPRLPDWSWVGERVVASMPEALGRASVVCAILGFELDREELAATLDSLDRSGITATLDPGFVIAELVAREVFILRGDSVGFRTASLRQALYEHAEPSFLKLVHEHALSVCRARAVRDDADDRTLEAWSRHAAALGSFEEAGLAALELAERHRAQHRHAEADARYTQAIGHYERAGVRSRDVARALIGRGASRYRVARAAEAVVDLDAAVELAVSLSDEALRAVALLERATALDWVGDLSASAASARAAEPIVEAVGDAWLRAALDVALGRAAWRRADLDQAIRLMADGAAQARLAGNHDARVIALMLLGCALVQTERLDEAERCFEEVLAVCEATGDRVHACVAYGNRSFLWCVQQDLQRGLADLAKAADLARQAGHPWPERNAVANAGELLFFCGRYDEALRHVRRSRFLEERFGDQPAFESAMLLARIQLARGEVAEAQRWFQWVTQTCPPGEDAPNSHAQYGAVSMVLEAISGATMSQPALDAGTAERAAWAAVLEASDAFLPDERLELLYWQAKWASFVGDTELRRDAQRRAEACPGFASWRLRFDSVDG
jgi:tetratricopeptide (TPR) repeat protein